MRIHYRLRSGPSYLLSCFRHEDAYGKLVRACKPGTPHENLQALQNYYIKDYVSHKCIASRKLCWSAARKEKSMDSLMLTKNGDYYELRENIEGTTRWRAKRVAKNQFQTDGVVELDWGTVGVHSAPNFEHLQNGQGQEEEGALVEVDTQEAVGKGVLVGKNIIAASKGWLQYE